MIQPKIIEVDFYLLMEKLKRAADARCLIEKQNKEEWKQYVIAHGVRETSLEAFGKVKFATGKAKLAAITLGSDWDGCYAYSVEDEVALKYVPGG